MFVKRLACGIKYPILNFLFILMVVLFVRRPDACVRWIGFIGGSTFSFCVFSIKIVEAAALYSHQPPMLRSLTYFRWPLTSVTSDPGVLWPSGGRSIFSLMTSSWLLTLYLAPRLRPAANHLLTLPARLSLTLTCALLSSAYSRTPPTTGFN